MPAITLTKPETFSLPNLTSPIVSRPSKIQVKTVMADYDTVKSMIAPLQLGSMREYKEYIVANNLTDIFPKTPQAVYSNVWVDTKDFLSMAQERIDARNLARSKKAVAVRLEKKALRKAEAMVQPKIEMPKTKAVTPNAVNTITQLIDLGVPVNLVESVFKSMDLSIAELKDCVIYLLNK